MCKWLQFLSNLPKTKYDWLEIALFQCWDLVNSMLSRQSNLSCVKVSNFLIKYFLLGTEFIWPSPRIPHYNNSLVPRFYLYQKSFLFVHVPPHQKPCNSSESKGTTPWHFNLATREKAQIWNYMTFWKGPSKEKDRYYRHKFKPAVLI